MIGRDNMAKKVTLDDIAAATNLSKFSVSRAIAGKSGISEQTRKVVLEACERLGYVKKGSPSGNEKKYVLFVIPKIDAKDTTFWMKVILGVESDLTLRGYSLHLKVTDQSENGVAERELDGAAGVIFAGHKSLEYIDMLQKYICPNLMRHILHIIYSHTIQCILQIVREHMPYVNECLKWGIRELHT